MKNLGMSKILRNFEKSQISGKLGFFASGPISEAPKSPHGVFCGNLGQTTFFFAEGGRKNRDIENLDDLNLRYKDFDTVCTTAQKHKNSSSLKVLSKSEEFIF